MGRAVQEVRIVRVIHTAPTGVAGDLAKKLTDDLSKTMERNSDLYVAAGLTPSDYINGLLLAVQFTTWKLGTACGVAMAAHEISDTVAAVKKISAEQFSVGVKNGQEQIDEAAAE